MDIRALSYVGIETADVNTWESFGTELLGMAQELLQIWSSTPGTTVMFITHSIPEAILLSDRVVVMSARPGRVIKTVDIELPRPRTESVRESPAFYQYENELRRLLINAETGIED